MSVGRLLVDSSVSVPGEKKRKESGVKGGGKEKKNKRKGDRK